MGWATYHNSSTKVDLPGTVSIKYDWENYFRSVICTGSNNDNL